MRRWRPTDDGCCVQPLKYMIAPWRTGSPVRPIEQQSLVDRVTDELHRAILNGDIAPGSAVSIVELCEQFDVSHIPVREALRRLESEGLLSLPPGPLRPGRLAERRGPRRTSTGCAGSSRATSSRGRRPGMTEERLDAAERRCEVRRDRARARRLAAAHHAFHAEMLADVPAPPTGGSWSQTRGPLLGPLPATWPSHWTREPPSTRRCSTSRRSGDAEALRDAWVDHLTSSERDAGRGAQLTGISGQRVPE